MLGKKSNKRPMKAWFRFESASDVRARDIEQLAQAIEHGRSIMPEKTLLLLRWGNENYATLNPDLRHTLVKGAFGCAERCARYQFVADEICKQAQVDSHDEIAVFAQTRANAQNMQNLRNLTQFLHTDPAGLEADVAAHIAWARQTYVGHTLNNRSDIIDFAQQVMIYLPLYTAALEPILGFAALDHSIDVRNKLEAIYTKTLPHPAAVTALMMNPQIKQGPLAA